KIPKARPGKRKSKWPQRMLARSTKSNSPNAMAARSKILGVDDDAAVRESLMSALSYEHFYALGAQNGDEGLQLLESHHPDLVLLDLNMPGKSGWQVFKEITAKQPLLPVVVLTARANQLFTSLGAGVGALIEKPVDFLKVLPAVLEDMNETGEWM